MTNTAAAAAASRREQIPMQFREGDIVGVDGGARTIDVVWTTGAPTLKRDWNTGQIYTEQLVVSEEAADLTRLNSGAPVLNTHQNYDLSNIIATVDRAWIDGATGKATIRFPSDGSDPAIDIIFRKVEQKIIRKLSPGYWPLRVEIDDTKTPELRLVTRWQVAELSFVPIPADDGASTLAASEKVSCEFVTRAAPATTTETTMETTAQAAAPATPAATPPNPNPAPAVETRAAVAPDTTAINAAVAAERTRITDINRRAAAAGLPQDVADDLITRGVSAEHAGNHLIDEMVKRGTRPTMAAALTPPGGLDAVETRRGAVVEALLHRAFPNREDCKLTERAREWRGLKLMELTRELLSSAGEKVRGLGPMELATRAFNTASDFPNILANVANKSLQMGYAAEKRTFLPFCTQHDAVDFKQLSSLQLGEGSNLEQVNEQGEFKRGTVGEGAEKWNLTTYGKIFGFTRQTLINDDVGAFTRLPFNFGQAGVRLENDIVWGILIANAAMSDTVALFHANHNNLQSGGASALALSSLGTMRKQFRTQKGLDGKQTLNLLQRYIMVGSSLETTLEQILSPVLYASQTSQIVPEYYRSLVPIVEARLDAISATAWFGACDPAQMATIEYGYLEGQQGVYLETRDGFNVDGVEMKVRHDFGAKAVNWRGLQKSAGA